MVEIFKQKKFPTLNTIIVGVVFSMVLIQVLAQFFGIWFAGAQDVKLGAGFLLLGVAASGLLAIALAKKIITNRPMNKEDTFAIIVVIGLTIAALIYLEDLIPSIFSVAVPQLKVGIQSMIPIP